MEKTPCLKLSLCVGVLVGCERASVPERQRPAARLEAPWPRPDHARFVNSAGQVRRLALSGLLTDDTWPSQMSARGSFEPPSPKDECRR
jgi:hypothetical protein